MKHDDEYMMNTWSSSLHRVVAGEADEAPEGQGEGVEDLGSRIQPGGGLGQLRQLTEEHTPGSLMYGILV